MGGCFVPGCKSGHGNVNGSHLFSAQKEVGEEWTKIMRQIRTDKQFNPSNRNHRICSHHFEDQYLIKDDYFQINGKAVSLPRQNWKLKIGSLPTIFLNLPKSIQPTVSKRRRHILKNEPEYAKRSKIIRAAVDDSHNNSTEINFFEVEEWWLRNSKNFPEWILHRVDRIVLCKLGFQNDCPIMQKSIVIKHNENHTQPSWKYFLRDLEITKRFSPISHNEETFHRFIQQLNNMEKCAGIQGFTHIKTIKGGQLLENNWYSTNCERVGYSVVCTPCKQLHQSLQRKNHRNKKTQRSKLSSNAAARKLKYYMKRSTRLALKRHTLRSQLAKIKTSLNVIELTDIEKMLGNVDVPAPMKSKILHCLQTAKVKSAKGMRYSCDWLLECLLLKIKPPAAYRHMREAKILPLPHPVTLSKLIAAQRCEFGFNKTSLEAIQRECKGKIRRDRQGMGILVFDEIQLRETLDYNKYSNRFDGYIDYGDYTVDIVKSSDKAKLANHALVLMYRPFNENWVQPIAAFATKNAASGTALHKVVLEAIVKLEQIGAEVLTVVCDGSKPNKSFWKMCGIGRVGDKIVNKVEHPCDENRKLYFSSDFPHIFKCIRNHIRKYVCVEWIDGEIDFSFYEALLSEDSKRECGLRKCPKLTRSHVQPNNFEKMVVPLATQLFSRSVATGLRFYRESNVLEFEGSEVTEQFTESMNELFDALNVRFTSEGVRLQSKHLKVLKELDHALDKYIKDLCPKALSVPFASMETLVGLKVTILSTIEIVEHLIADLGFSYVLTGKVTQDCLEKFFGLIRAAGGREEHPTVCNFIQLFRLLSLYNPVKRILRGNVRSEDTVDVLVPFSDELRAASKRERELQNNKRKCLEDMIIDKIHSFGDTDQLIVWNTDTSTNELDKKIVYHLAGFLCFKANKFLKCKDCVKTMSVPSAELKEYSILTDILNYGPLHHPSAEFFSLILRLETAICESIKSHAICGDIMVDCIQRVSLCHTPNLGCQQTDHLEQIIATLFPYYITMRLHFFARSKRNELGHGKETKNKRKESKLKS